MQIHMPFHMFNELYPTRSFICFLGINLILIYLLIAKTQQEVQKKVCENSKKKSGAKDNKQGQHVLITRHPEREGLLV